MYFHLIGIKEKDGKQYDLDFLLEGNDENVVRDFLSHWGVVIVSLTEFKDNPDLFGNIAIILVYSGYEFKLITKGEDLSESMLFFISLGLKPVSFNFIDKPISENQMKSMLNSTFLSVEEENKKKKEEREMEEIKEKKIYEESSVKDGLKIINSNISHIEQVLKSGQGILSSSDIKDLDNLASEMKKIRLGTNFNKMASLVLDSHILLERAENEIFNSNSKNKFLINKNSIITNIDVLHEYFEYTRASEKNKLQHAGLTTSESIETAVGMNFIFFKLLRRDMIHQLDGYSVDDFFDIVLNSLEFIIILIILIISMIWLFAPLLGVNKFSLYLLPAMGWLGLLVYLLNNLSLKGFMSRIISFLILAGIYWYGLTLLVNTFAL